jgi:uncharacterized repeat protein (TIGR04052 family)
MRALSLPVLLLLGTTFACTNKEPEPEPEPEDTAPEFREVTIGFRAVVDRTPFSCANEYSYQGVNDSSTVRISDFRMLVHNVALLNDALEATLVELDDNGTSQDGEVALLDFEDGTFLCAAGTPELYTTITGKVLAGDYSGLSFTVGVPFERNHTEFDEAAAPPLNDPRMFRSVLQGHYFLRVDLATVGEPNGYPLHVSSTGCQANDFGGIDRCLSPNRVTFTLPAFDPQAQEVTFDLGVLMDRNDLDVNGSLPSTPPVETPNGCQSDVTDPDCQAFFISYGMSALPQTWVTAE